MEKKIESPKKSENSKIQKKKIEKFLKIIFFKQKNELLPQCEFFV